MRVARYAGQGRVEIVDEPAPSLPPGGILIRTEASGLCSGELMAWYMERKVPHVLGHEVAGEVVESDDPRFPVGSRVAPHHHAPCGTCEWCRTGRFVHCPTWKATKLVPGGLVEAFAVSAENLADAYRVDGLDPRDAALMEPLACVMKSIRLARTRPHESVAVLGLGVMGLLHMLAWGEGATGYDLNPARMDWAAGKGLSVRTEPEPADVVFVCPGTPAAFQQAMEMARPGGTIVMFSPFAPGEAPEIDWDCVYFKELAILPSYSCGPNDTAEAIELLRAGTVRAEQVVSHFIEMDELPEAYVAMKAGEILKPMVVFP